MFEKARISKKYSYNIKLKMKFWLGSYEETSIQASSRLQMKVQAQLVVKRFFSNLGENQNKTFTRSDPSEDMITIMFEL